MKLRATLSAIIVLPVLICMFGLIAFASHAPVAGVCLLLASVLTICLFRTFIYFEIMDQCITYRMLIFMHWTVPITDIDHIELYYFKSVKGGGTVLGNLILSDGSKRGFNCKWLSMSSLRTLLLLLRQTKPEIAISAPEWLAPLLKLN